LAASITFRTVFARPTFITGLFTTALTPISDAFKRIACLLAIFHKQQRSALCADVKSSLSYRYSEKIWPENTQISDYIEFRPF